MKLAVLLFIVVSLSSAQYIPKGFSTVSLSSLKTDSNVANAYALGKPIATNYLIQNNYISNNPYNVTANVSISKKIVGTTTYYAFEVQLNNYIDFTVDMTFIVSLKAGIFTFYTYGGTPNQTAPSKFVPLNLLSVTSDPVVQSLQSFGLQQTVQTIVAQAPAISSDFVINQINSISKMNLYNGGTFFYQYKVAATNGNNDSLIAGYVVSYSGNISTAVYIASAFIVVQSDGNCEVGDITTDGYIQLFDVDLNSSLVQNALSSGTQQLLLQAVTDGKIVDTNFQVTTLNSGWTSSSCGTITNYRFDVVLGNNKLSSIQSVFTVSYDTTIGITTLQDYSYTVTTGNV